MVGGTGSGLSLAYSAMSALRSYVIGSGSALNNNALVLPTRRPLQAESYVNRVRFATHAGSFILTEQPRTDVTVEGVVVRLSRDHHYGPGVVVIEGIADDSGTLRRYHLELVERDYNEAFRAHGEGLRVVARGDLATRGSYKWLRPTRSFAIIPGLEDETLLQMGKQPAPSAAGMR